MPSNFGYGFKESSFFVSEPGQTPKDAETPKARTPEPENAPEPKATEPQENYKDDLIRLQAEYVNYRKRVERDKQAAKDIAVQSFLSSLLPVLDDISAARGHGDLQEGPFSSIAKKFESILNQHGLRVVDESGVAFDPTIHEAVIAQPVDGFDPDTVAQVFRIGYVTENGLLRAAQVLVAQ